MDDRRDNNSVGRTVLGVLLAPWAAAPMLLGGMLAGASALRSPNVDHLTKVVIASALGSVYWWFFPGFIQGVLGDLDQLGQFGQIIISAKWLGGLTFGAYALVNLVLAFTVKPRRRRNR